MGVQGCHALFGPIAKPQGELGLLLAAELGDVGAAPGQGTSGLNDWRVDSNLREGGLISGRPCEGCGARQSVTFLPAGPSDEGGWKETVEGSKSSNLTIMLAARLWTLTCAHTPYIVDPANLGDSLSEQLSTQFPIRLLYGRKDGATQYADGHGFGTEGCLPRHLILFPLVVGQGSAEACQKPWRRKQVGSTLPFDLWEYDQLMPLFRIVQPPTSAEGVAEAALSLAAAQRVAVRLGLERAGASLTPQFTRRAVQIYRWPL